MKHEQTNVPRKIPFNCFASKSFVFDFFKCYPKTLSFKLPRSLLPSSTGVQAGAGGQPCDLSVYTTYDDRNEYSNQSKMHQPPVRTNKSRLVSTHERAGTVNGHTDYAQSRLYPGALATHVDIFSIFILIYLPMRIANPL